MDPGFIHQEFRQVFQADQCALRGFDAADFSAKMRGRKLIMIGDSIMRLHFYSLACLMRGQVCLPPFLSDPSTCRAGELTGKVLSKADLIAGESASRVCTSNGDVPAVELGMAHCFL